MTGFGIFMVIWYVFSIASSFYIIGRGGIEITPGSAFISILMAVGILLGLLFVGTGFGI